MLGERRAQPPGHSATSAIREVGPRVKFVVRDWPLAWKLRQLQLDFLARQRFESACQALELVSIKAIGWLRQWNEVVRAASSVASTG